MASQPVLDISPASVQELQSLAHSPADYLIFSDALVASSSDERQAVQWQFNQYLELAEKLELRLVLLSSAAVFKPGRQAPYLEGEEADAQSAYGQWLWGLEQQLRELGNEHLILRTGHLIGSLSDSVWQQLSSQEISQLSNASHFLPTHYDDLARALVAMLLQLESAAPRFGTYHYVSAEATSELAFAQALCRALALKDKRFEELELAVSEVCEQQYALLNCDKAMHTFGLKQRPWRSYLTQLSQLYLAAQTTGKELEPS